MLELKPSAAAPIRLWLGTRENPDQQVIAISRSSGYPCDFRVQRSGEDVSFVFQWNLSGVALTQSWTLAPNEEAIRLRTTIDNRGAHWITGLFLGLEGLALSPNPETESLQTGGVSGKSIADPRHSLAAGTAFVKYPAGQRAFSVPPTVPNSLLATWMDYSDPIAGLGTGYVDRDMDLVGEVRAEPDGLVLGWRLFRLEGTRGFLWGITGPRQVYPLAPGEQFSSSEWMLMFHAGDWHRTAAAYRQRYEATLGRDFLNWERTSPTVRECDVVLNNQIAWGNPSPDRKRAYDYPNGRVIHRFDQIAPQTKESIQALDARPENVIVNILGTGPDWGIYRMPDHFPMNEAAGGQAAAEKMVRDLHRLGIRGVCCYAHPYFMHRSARNYVPEADTGWNYPHQDWHTSMGGIACMGEDKWIEMWEREIFPRYVAMGVLGLYWDEGFGHQFICTNARHSHGGSSLSLLTAQSRGATRLYQAFRSLAGPQGFLSCETASDVQARFIDLWHFNPTEVLRYTHPDRLSKANIDPKHPFRSIGEAFVFGCPVIVMPYPENRGKALEGELLEALRQFVRLRRDLRQSKAPGYPNAFRDLDGIQEMDPGLRAKVFTNQNGTTLAYYAEQPFDGQLRVNQKRIALKLNAREMGYRIL